MYLAFLHPQGSLGLAVETLQHVVIHDYIPFIVLLFSLYTISGGIRIEGDLPAHPLTNATFMAVGGLLASFIGTTGAAMLLIRPLLETNGERKHVAHTVVFFIFVVCNCGGLLLPLGDPPLFLGYLERRRLSSGRLSLWKHWLFVNGMLLAVYFAARSLLLLSARDESRISPPTRPRCASLTFSGIWPNALLLLGHHCSRWRCWIPASRFPAPTGILGSTCARCCNWRWSLVSLLMGAHAVREANSFDYLAIVEVGVLFIGIFVAMQPALEILHVARRELGIDTPHKFFWASGWLSSVLDNAPTYLVFFKTAQALSDHALPRTWPAWPSLC